MSRDGIDTNTYGIMAGPGLVGRMDSGGSLFSFDAYLIFFLWRTERSRRDGKMSVRCVACWLIVAQIDAVVLFMVDNRKETIRLRLLECVWLGPGGICRGC